MNRRQPKNHEPDGKGRAVAGVLQFREDHNRGLGIRGQDRARRRLPPDIGNGGAAAGMDAGILPTLEMVATDLGSGPQDYLLFTYRRTDLSAASIASAPQSGTDLSSWNTAVDGVNGVKILIDDNHVFSPPSPRIMPWLVRF